MKSVLMLSWVFLLTARISSADATELAGIHIPPSVNVKSQSLSLNGVGIRRSGFLFVKVKVYVAALYLAQKSTDPNEIITSSGAKRVEFTFLRDVIDQDVKEAWKFQFNESVSEPYPELDSDLKQLLSFMEALKQGDKQSYEMEADLTRFYVNQNLKGTIKGRGFQKAFLSIWIGKKPAQNDLKEKLLGLED